MSWDMGGEGTSKEMEDIELPFTNEICLAFLFCRLVLMKIKMFHHKTLKSMTHCDCLQSSARKQSKSFSQNHWDFSEESSHPLVNQRMDVSLLSLTWRWGKRWGRKHSHREAQQRLYLVESHRLTVVLLQLPRIAFELKIYSFIQWLNLSFSDL